MPNQIAEEALEKLRTFVADLRDPKSLAVAILHAFSKKNSPFILADPYR